MKCVIVGNGKSLTSKQLDLCVGVKSFACNRISLIYPETFWRPDFYIHPESVTLDTEYIQENIDLGIECYLGEHFAPPPRGKGTIEDAPNIHWINDHPYHSLNFDNPEVPDEWILPQLCSFGGSVNVAMQIAVLNGYDELILLGCDLLYKNGKGKSHFHKDYEHGGEQDAFYAARNALFGHMQCLNYIRRRNKKITVVNATEGGLLELWQRVRLEDVVTTRLLEV